MTTTVKHGTAHRAFCLYGRPKIAIRQVMPRFTGSCFRRSPDVRHCANETAADVAEVESPIANWPFRVPQFYWNIELTKPPYNAEVMRPGEIRSSNTRRTGVVGIFSNEEAIIRLVGAILLEQNNEWPVRRARYMTLESFAPISDGGIIKLSAVVG